MASRSDEISTRAVGPYLLQRTLGKGQTGELIYLDYRHQPDGVWF